MPQDASRRHLAGPPGRLLPWGGRLPWGGNFARPRGRGDGNGPRPQPGSPHRVAAARASSGAVIGVPCRSHSCRGAATDARAGVCRGAFCRGAAAQDDGCRRTPAGVTSRVLRVACCRGAGDCRGAARAARAARAAARAGVAATGRAGPAARAGVSPPGARSRDAVSRCAPRATPQRWVPGRRPGPRPARH